MADSGATALGPSGSTPSSSTFQLEVSTLAGGCLATIPDAQGSWRLIDVLGRLPELLPGRRYQLLRGEAVLAAGTAIAEWAQPVDGRACVTAVVVVAPLTLEEQRQLDTALLTAAGALDVEKVRELLSTGADARSLRLRTALHEAIEARGIHRPSDGEEKERDAVEQEGRLEAVLGALLSARADAEATRREAPALHAAVQRGSLGAVRVLLDARANINVAATDEAEMDAKSTALHMATQAGNLPLAAVLIERGADANIIRRYRERQEGGRFGFVPVRETALHMAVAGGHRALVALLVQAGADASITRSRDGKESSVEELCAGNPDMLDTLNADSSAALLAGGGFGVEVEAALAAIAARRGAA